MALQLLYHDWKMSPSQRDSPGQLPEGKRYPQRGIQIKGATDDQLPGVTDSAIVVVLAW